MYSCSYVPYIVRYAQYLLASRPKKISHLPHTIGAPISYRNKRTLGQFKQLFLDKKETYLPTPTQKTSEMSGDSSEPTNVEGTKRNLDDDVKAGTPSKRVRKSAVVFAPSVRKTDVKTNRVIVGRGKALGDIEACKASMDKSKLSSAEMNNAHKVLIGGGKPAKKDIRKNLRAFNGYLPKLEDGKTEKDMKVEDYTLKVSKNRKSHCQYVS